MDHGEVRWAMGRGEMNHGKRGDGPWGGEMDHGEVRWAMGRGEMDHGER